jgi:hypothetical protein
MDPNHDANKIKGIAGLMIAVFAIIGFVVFLIIQYRDVKQIEKDGVYVVGKITSSTSRKNGRSFTFTYVYKGNAYETALLAPTYKYKEGDLKFIRISSSNPSNSMFGDDYPQPGPCITFENAPAEGWKEIPECK